MSMIANGQFRQPPAIADIAPREKSRGLPPSRQEAILPTGTCPRLDPVMRQIENIIARTAFLAVAATSNRSFCFS